MQLTLNIKNEQLFDNIIWFLNRFKNDGLEIIMHKKETPLTPNDTQKKGLDFSAFQVESLKELDGLEFQKKIRNEW